MLVVTRRPGEDIVTELPAGALIEVVALSVKDNQVGIGTEAPQHILVVRDELLERISLHQKASARGRSRRWPVAGWRSVTTARDSQSGAFPCSACAVYRLTQPILGVEQRL